MAEKKLPKLHELVAVRSGLRGQATKCLADLMGTFEKKQHHFTARVKTFTPFGEDAVIKVEEQLDLQTTVEKELRWIADHLVKAIDMSHSVNVGNTGARADIMLEDGTLLVKDVPAQTLLELEGELETLRAFCERIPTLDPAKGFHPDPQREKGVFVAREVEKTRTQKQNKVVVLYPHTDKHPAQTQIIPEDVPIGTIREQEWSSMMTVATKAQVMDRVEKLARAVKKARSRANETPVESTPIAEKLVSYVFWG